MSKDSYYVQRAFISRFDMLNQDTETVLNPIVKAVMKNTEDQILEQLSELVKRGLLVVQDEKPVLTASYLASDQDGVEFKIARQIKLVLKDQEYIERLEQEIQDLTNRLLDVNTHFQEVTERLEKITVAMQKHKE